jgi:flavodoxin
MKSLVVYFSHKGENWDADGLVDLKVGNTEVAAKKLAASLGADLFEVVPEKEYPWGYKECCDVAKIEFTNRVYPAYQGDIDVTPYGIVAFCFPMWWGSFPMVLGKFIKDHDFSGKIILPLITHEGSGLGNGVKDLKKALPNSDVRGGLAITGHTVSTSDKKIRDFIEANHL